MADNPFKGLLEEFKHAPPAGKALALVALVVVSGVGLYVGLHKSGASSGASSGANVLPVDPSLSGASSGIPFPNISSPAAPVAGGVSIPAAPSYQKQTINPLGKGTSGYSNNFYTYTTKGGESIASLNQLAGWNGTGNNVQFYRNNADILRNIGYLDSNGAVVNPDATLPQGVKLSL